MNDGEDMYAAGWERGYLAGITDVAAEAHRVGDLTARGKLQRLLTDLTSQMRVHCERYDVGAS